MKLRPFTLALAVAATVLVPGGSAQASSHREAPFVTEHPKVDATDFYMFRSYEPGRDGYVTLIANYIPLQDPYGGPNYFAMDPQALYEIHVDNNGDAKEDLSFQFRFNNTLKDTQLIVGGKKVSIPLINSGAISAGNTANLNVTESYNVTLVRGNRRSGAIISTHVRNVHRYSDPRLYGWQGRSRRARHLRRNAKTMADRPAPLEYNRRWPMRLWLFGVFFFLYAPLLALIAFSFNDSKKTVVWNGFTLRHYVKLYHDTDLIAAFGNSLSIALVTTVLSLILGALAAVMLWRFRFPLKAPIEAALSMPIVVPEICMGVAMLVFFSRVLPWPYDLPWPLSLGAILIAHVSFCFPFVTMVVRARLASFNKEQEEAARDLGASDWQAFRDVLLPHMTPALIAGALLSFTLSLDDFVITFFTSGPNTVTFPVKVYSMVRFSVTPEVNAASTMLIVLTVAVMAAMMLAQRPQPKSS